MPIHNPNNSDYYYMIRLDHSQDKISGQEVVGELPWGQTQGTLIYALDEYWFVGDTIEPSQPNQPSLDTVNGDGVLILATAHHD